MSKISTYEVVPVPKLSDKLIGTSVGGEIEDVTYNFTLLELLELFLPVIPANNLQGVLDYGNTATQDINLFGTITTTNLDVTETANLFITYLNEETHIVGGVYDSEDSIGTSGQVLTSTGEGVAWVTLPPIFTPNLQQVLTEGNTADIDILLDANLEALDISSNTATIANNLTIDGTITDNNSSVGGSGQVLESTGTGLQWVDLPVYSATSPLSFNSATKTFSIQPANSSQGGYLTANDWITFNGKQDAGSYITALTGEATATGPGSVPITLNNASVIAKVLTGLNVTGGSISASDSILTAFGKVQNQINGLVGGVQYQGTWDAATNNPFLQSSIGVQGHFYIVNVAGNTNLNGITDWKVGDWAIYSGGAWSKVDNTESVTSVNGQIGAVSLTTDDIPEGATNLYYLDSRARAALSFAAGSGAYNSLTGVITIPTNNNQILNGAGYITLASLSASAPLSYNNLTGGFAIQKSDATHDGYLSSTDWSTFNNKQNYLGGTGLVKSTAGTISYITDNSGNWNAAYDRSIVSAAVTGTSTKTLTLTEQDGNTIQASWTDLDTGLTSVGVSMPSAFTVTNSPLTANGTIGITGAGTTLQYIDGTGALQTFPGLTGFVPYTGANQNVNLGEYGISAGYFQADLTPSGALQVGRMQWNSTDGTMDLRLLGNNVTLQIGEENVTRVVNKSGIDLLEENYQVVRLRKVAEGGAQGQRIAVVLAQGNTENNSTEVIGVVTETILANQEGFVTSFGEVKEINTTGSLQGETWVDGDILYLSSTVAGGLTNVRSTAPNHSVIVAYVSYAHAIHGKIYMAIDTGYELGELHNVYAPSPTANQSIYWNVANSRYQLNTIGGILGYTPANAATTLTINGTTYDLSANRTWNVGTVTSVAALTLGTSGTDLSSSVANSTTTPVITLNVPTASAANRGALSAADWATFNNKVTSVGASSPLASTGGATPTISIQVANGSQNGYLSSSDWTTFNNKQAAGNYITSLTGEATATGPGAASVTLVNASVTAKVLTGVNITGGSISATDSILTAFGKVQNQINGLIGGSIYQGTWNANTNNPSLSSGVGTKGYYYIVSVAGTTNLDGITDWFVGDWAIFDGTAWQQVDNTDAVVSVNGQTGAVSLTTDNIPQGTTNLYFTDAYARAALSFAAGSGAYNSTTGVITIPTNTSQLTNGAAFITLASLSGTAPIQYNNTTGAISITQAGAASNGFLSSTDWNTFNNKQATLSLTTTGTSGAATLVGATLNIPIYQAAGTYVNSVTASAPLSSSGGVNPNITISQSSGSTNGFLSSTDWTTFNNKQNALTNPVTGTGTNNYIAKFTSTGSTIGNSLLQSTTSNVFINQEDTSIGIDAQAAIRLGFTKKSGFNPTIAYATDPFTISSTTGTSIDATNTFTTRFQIAITGEGTIYNNFAVQNAATSGTGFFIDQTARSSGRQWSILNGNTAVGEFSIKDETGALTRYKIGTDGASTFNATTYNVANFNSTYGQSNINIQNNGVTFAVIGSGISVTSTALYNDVGIGTAGLNNDIVFATGVGYTERVRINSTGVFKIANLAGTGSRIVVADASGNLTASSALSGYVPYTGATTNVNLGNNSLNIGGSAIADRMFQVSGVNFTTGTSQFMSVFNTTFNGTITNVYGIYAGNNFSTGTITNSYNLYIESTNTGSATVTNRYGIYQAGATDINNFQGNTQINGLLGAADDKGLRLRGINDSTHRLYYSTTRPGIILEVNNTFSIDYYNSGSPSTPFTFSTGGNFTSAATINAGDSITLQGELYFGGIASNRYFRLLKSGSVNAGVLNYAFFNGTSWVVTSTLNGSGDASFVGDVSADSYTSSGVNGNNASYDANHNTDYTVLRSALSGTRRWQIDDVAGRFQIYMQGTANLYAFNISTTGNVGIRVAGSTASDQYFTTGDAGVAYSNTYFGTGTVRIGGGADAGANTVLSVAPGVITFDRPGVVGGAFKVHSDGKIGINETTNNGYQLEVGGNGRFSSTISATAGIFSVSAGTPLQAYQTAATNSTTAVIRQTGAGGNGNQDIGLIVDIQGANDADRIANFRYYDGTSYYSRMAITRGGSVGIRTSSPTQPLTVNQATANTFNQGIPATSGTTQNGILRLQPSTNVFGETLDFGMNVGPTYAWIQSTNASGLDTKYPLVLNPTGGNVAIGGIPNLRLSVFDSGSVISSGTVTFASQAKGLEIYNNISGTTDNLIGLWFSTGPHKSGIASGRTNAASTWGVDLRFFVHGPEIAQLDQTYEKMRLLDTGYLLVGYSSSQGSYMIQANGSIYASAFYESSDIRLKNVINKYSSNDFGAITFNWKDNRDTKLHWGYSAQDVMKFLPDAVNGTEELFYTLDYNQVHTYKIAMLEKRIEELESQIKNK